MDFQDNCCFSILYLQKGKHNDLNLIAPSAIDCDNWVNYLHLLLTDVEVNANDEVGLPKWLRKMWDQADIDKNDTLDLDSITNLMKLLHLPLSKSEIKSAMKLSLNTKKQPMNFNQFVKFYRNIKFRPEIAELYENWCSEYYPYHISFEQFQRFCIDIQKEPLDICKFRDVFEKFKGKEDAGMDMDHFTAFLMSSKNPIFNREFLTVNQDMNQPLQKYFINSSHNTYPYL